MDGCTCKDSDHGKHIVIKKEITIEFEESTKRIPKTLEVVSNRKIVKVKAKALDDARSLVRHWTLANEICMVPDRDYSLTFRVSYTTAADKKKGLRGVFKNRKGDPVEVSAGYNVVVDKIEEQDDTKISVNEKSCTVSFEVAGGDIDCNIVDNSVDYLKPLLPDRVKDIIDQGSSDTFLQDVKRISAILDSIPLTEDALSFIEGTVKTIGDAHPLAKAILTALSIPYKLLKNENEFKQNVKDLAETMRFTAKCVADVRDHTKIRSAKEQLASIAETLKDAAQYLNTYVRRGWIGQFVGAQFPKKVLGYMDALMEVKNRFQMAIIIQIARDADETASMTSVDFLRKHLRPVEVGDLSHGCLEGTREKILRDIRSWLQDPESEENILWLSGPPGAGKSTIANTIAKELASASPFCVMFSCRRDVPDLRDPRKIWPTLAFDLADKHGGVKAALMATVNEKKGAFRHYTVIEQFENFIQSPLDTHVKETSRLSRSPAYPVLIIDALDECYTSGDAHWDSLLNSLTCWSELRKGAVKLIVTSRNLDDLYGKLNGTSCPVLLTAGDDVSEDSKADVGVFFRSKFAEIRKAHWSSRRRESDWPGERIIQQLTYYAAGLFVWADTVVQYVGQRTGGSDPKQRLEAILIDTKMPGSGVTGASQVDYLYARIVFEAFRHSIADERSRAKNTLTMIVLAKRPLVIEELVDLQSTDEWDARDAIESTLRLVSPIIPTHNINHRLRVCHKTVSDFLLSPSRSNAAIEHVVEHWNRQRPDDQVSDPHSFVINAKEEERDLALACMRLLHRKFSTNIKLHTQALDYACNHWLEHLEGAGVVRIPGFKHLANAIKLAYGSLQRYYGEVSVMGMQKVALLEHLRGISEFVSRCTNGEQTEVENLQQEQEISEHAKNLDIVRGEFQIAMIVKYTSESSESFLQKRLQPADQTVLDSPCLQGTRTSILQHAKNWLADTNQPNILWIVGGPGAGKSAIATTLVNDFTKDAGRLCVKVFAKRDFEDRRDPMSIWRTIVNDLASLQAGLKGSIMEALWGESRQSKNAAENQLRFRSIVVKALEEHQYLSFVFVIDALDECFSEDNEHWRALLQTLSTCAKLPFKFVITSRDIPGIRRVLEGVSSCINLETVSGDSKKKARADIEVFLRTRFEELPKDSGDARSYWIQANIIHKLMGSADSFIWAKMIVELVKRKPHSRVDDILNHNNAGNGTNLKVDALYAKVLFDVLGPLLEKERELFRSVLAFVVLAKNPLREGDLVELVRVLPSFLSKNEKQVVNVVKEFSSVISIGNNELLRIPHKSFVDFLLDRDHDRSLSAMKLLLPTGSDPRSFIVNWKEDSANIAIACLRIMSDALEFNACRITTSLVLNDEIPGLEAHVSENIKPSLIYACRFWGEHLNDCSRDDQQFRGQVEPLLGDLLHENLLSWLEILSLSKAVPTARRCLEIAKGVLKAYSNELEDARRFVDMFEEPIAAAASHIYLSALPFCPSDSWIARTYGPRYMNVLSVVKGRLVGWNSAAQEPDAHTKGVNDIAFFPDGRKLASGSEDRTLRIWDAKTGEALSAPLTSHMYQVSNVAVSPDGSQIASSDWSGVLRIWDSNTGACPLGSINAHSNVIWSVAFSPDGSRIVTGSSDNTVKVWNVATGDLCFGPLTGHTDTVRDVAFSINGTVIASGSHDRTIRIWDARTGEPRGKRLTGHNGTVWCIAFSADGRYLASGSSDRTIRLWDVEQGFSPTCSTTVNWLVTSISFSSSSNCLMAGYYGGTLCFWIVRSRTIEQIGDEFRGHGNEVVRSVAFAPDGQSVASCGDDRGIKIWRVGPQRLMIKK